MICKVTAKQESSKMCIVCGLKNKFGLRASFYEMDKNELVTVFKPSHMHQSYPNRLHGGIAATALEEAVKENIKAQIPLYVFKTQNHFLFCIKCRKYFWRGTHYNNINNIFRFINTLEPD